MISQKEGQHNRLQLLNLHSFVGHDPVRSARLQLADNLSGIVHFNAAQDVFWPGNPTKIRRIPAVAQMDKSAPASTSWTALRARSSSSVSPSSASTSLLPRGPLMARLTLAREE